MAFKQKETILGLGSLTALNESDNKTVEYTVYLDLKEKYDVLAHQLRTMEMEKTVLNFQMQEMEEENVDLKEENSANLETIENDSVTTPLFGATVRTMSLALEDAQILTESISAQNDEYKDLTVQLNKEHGILKEQNKKYQIALEKMKTEQQQKDIEYENKLKAFEDKKVELNKENTDIQQKYEQLSNEMDKLKDETDEKLKKQMEALAVAPDADVGELALENHNTRRLLFQASQRSIGGNEAVGSTLLSPKANKSNNKTRNSTQNVLLLDAANATSNDSDVHQRNISYYIKQYVSNPHLQIAQYDSVASLPGLNNAESDKSTGGYVSGPGIGGGYLSGGYQSADSIDVAGFQIIDEENDDENDNVTNKQNDQFDQWLLTLINQNKEKDKQIEHITHEYQEQVVEVTELEKMMNKLKQQNNTLLQQIKEGNDGSKCTMFDWFK